MSVIVEGITKSRDGHNIYSVLKNGKNLTIGSKYNYEKDICDFENNLSDLKIDTTIILFGIGDGKHLNLLEKYISRYNKIFIVEPCSEIINKFIQTEEYEKLRVICNLEIIRNDVDINYVDSILDLTTYNNFKIIIFSNYKYIFEEEYLQLLRYTNKTISRYNLNKNTLNSLNIKMYDNFISNLRFMHRDNIINKFKDMYKGKTALIISAGPSFQRVIEELRNFKSINEKFVIVAGNRTLKPLLENGIKPHVVCSIDPQDFTYELMKNVCDSEVPLVYLAESNKILLNEYKGPKVYAKSLGSSFIDEKLNVNVDSLLSGGSVAHISMDLAVYLGCTRIVLIGQDLAYINGKSHSDISSIKGDGTTLKYIDDIYTTDIYGNKVRTSSIFLYFKNFFEDYIKSYKSIEFINCSYGANIEGAKFAEIRDILNSAENEEHIEQLNVFDNKNGDFLRWAEEIYDSIEILEKKSCEAKKYIDDILKIRSIKKIRTKLNKVKNINELLIDDNVMEKLKPLSENFMANIPSYFQYEEYKCDSELEKTYNLVKAFQRYFDDYIYMINEAKKILEKYKE